MNKRDSRRSSIKKSSQNDFQIIEENKLNNPKVDNKERKQMITVLRNNSKILTQQEKSLNTKFQRVRKEEGMKPIRLAGDLKVYHTVDKKNESERMQISESRGRSSYNNKFRV